jgi:hypothetical protein
MSRDNTRRIYALAWLSILLAACGGTVTSSGRDGGAGSSGFGGSSGSGGTGGTGGVSDNLVDVACGLMNALPCPLTNCEAELGEALYDSKVMGCGPQFADLLTCGNSNGWVCFGSGEHEEPYPPSACDSFMDAVAACQQHDTEECAGSSNGSECSVYCTSPDTWGARCVNEGTYLNCTCDTGPNDGFAFSMTGDCSSDLSSADSFCR